MTDDGRIEYVASAPDKVQAEMKRLYEDIKSLLLAQLSFEESSMFKNFDSALPC